MDEGEITRCCLVIEIALMTIEELLRISFAQADVNTLDDDVTTWVT